MIAAEPIARGKRGAEWICCQLGAREHYVIPRALHRHGRLAHLVTDAWVPPDSLWRALPGRPFHRLRERYHAELAAAAVRDLTASLLAHEVLWRASARLGWDLFTVRNQWFQRRAAEAIERLPRPGESHAMLFAHSYAALEIFKRAKPRGFTLVLGQIDPGPEHFDIVTRSARAAPGYGAPPAVPPARYFDDWREECALADYVVVNSEWSRSCLERAGIPAGKLVVVPLAYDPNDSTDASPADRCYPDAFSAARPLRLLFVGHLAVAKGASALLESMALLHDVPFELSIVGEMAIRVPPQYLEHPAVRWVGPVSRSEVMRRYREADVLIFPSLSDGFGMAQIEAQGWRLPIIASRSCGRVVRHGVNGLLLDEVSPGSIASAVRTVAADPRRLAEFARHSAPNLHTGLAALAESLIGLEPRA